MGKIWKKEIKEHFLGFEIFQKGAKVHTCCALLWMLLGPWLWGFAVHALGVLGAIIKALLTYSIVVYMEYLL